MAVALQTAVTALNSEKPTDRTNGIEAYKRIFSKDKTLKALKGNETTWIQVFQAIFRCVYSERVVYERKGGLAQAPTLQVNRLAAAGRLLRWLIERANLYFERKTVKPLVNHLIQTLDAGGQLLQPLALDYFKSLHTVLAHPPHCHSLDASQWINAVTLCFNVVLSRPIKNDLVKPQDDFWSNTEKTDDGTFSEPQPLGMEGIEQMSCLEELMGSQYAPLLTEEHLSTTLLAHYVDFFETFTTESSAHIPAVAGLNHLLHHVELNESKTMQAFALRISRHLVRLWATKSRVMKEHLVVTFRIILPHLIATVRHQHATPTRDQGQQKQVVSILEFLQKQLTSDADNRFSIGPLSTSNLRLTVNTELEERSSAAIFTSATFGPGRTFTAPAALSWATLELTAAVVAHLVSFETQSPTSTASAPDESWSEAEEAPSASSASRKRSLRTRNGPSMMPSATQTDASLAKSGSSPSKKRRFETPRSRGALHAILDSLPLANGESLPKAHPRRLWNLQVLAVVISGHGAKLTDQALAEISVSLKNLLHDEDEEVQNWAFLSCAELACLRRPSTQELIDYAWTFSIRRMSSPQSCRAAAVAASATLASDRLDTDLVLNELTSLLSELELNAPPYPHDSICQFFVSALDLSRNNVTLSKKQYESRVLAWLFNSWQPTVGITKGAQGRLQVNEQDVYWTYQLLSRIGHMSNLLCFERETFVMPGCPIVDQMLYEREVAPVSNLLIEAKIETRAQQTGKAKASSDANSRKESSTATRSPTALELRMIRYFIDAINTISDEWSQVQSEEPTFAELATVEQTRRSVDLTVLALLLDSTLYVNGVKSDGQLSMHAHKLLVCATKTLAETNRWSVVERTSLLQSLHPVIAGATSSPWVGVPHLLTNTLSPGLRSGLRRNLLTSTDESGGQPSRSRCALQTIWRRAPLDCCEEIIRHLEGCSSILCDCVCAEDDEDTTDGDDWGQIKHAKVDSASLMKPAENIGRDTSAVLHSAVICANALIEIPHVSEGMQPSTQSQKHLTSLLLDENLLAIDRLGSEVFAGMRRDHLQFNHRTATSLMTRLGTEYLPDYRFVKSEHAQLLVLDYLQSTLEIWTDAEQGDTDLAARSEEFCVHFARSLEKKKGLSWRVRIRAAAFFEQLLMTVVRRDGWIENDDMFSASELSALIYSQAGDPDFRVRFAAAAPIARLFEYCPPGKEETFSKTVWLEMLKEPSHLEGMLTRGLTHANAMVLSSPMRSQCFFLLLEPCTVNQVTNTHTKSLVSYVAHCLGFESSQELFGIFAAQLTYGWLSNNYDPTRLPYDVLGFPSMRSCLEQTFEGIGSMMAAMSVDQDGVLNQLMGLARSIRKSESEGVQECLPSVVAIELVFGVQDVLQSRESQDLPAAALQNMRGRITKGATPLAKDEAISNVLKEGADRIIVALLTHFWEECADPSNSFLKLLEQSDSETAHNFGGMNQSARGTRLETFPHEPMRPNARGLTVFHALQTLMTQPKPAEQQGLVYHVVFGMLSLVYTERFVNDQVRHLTALKLFLAMNAHTVSSSGSILSTLLHGCSVLIGQPDLVHAVSGLCTWALEKATALPKSPQQLGLCLTKIGEKASQFLVSPFKIDKRLGSHLFDWLDDHLLRLLKSPVTSKHALDACCAYPRELSDELRQWFANRPFTLSMLSDAIRRTKSTALGPHLLRRLHNCLQTCTDEEQLDAFARCNIWHVFSRLPSEDLTNQSTELARSLADIIFSLDGAIKTPSAVQQQSNALSQRHSLLQSLLNRAEQPHGPIKAYIALQVWDIVRGDDLAQAAIALQHLRALAYCRPEFPSIVDKWPEGIAEEIQYCAQLPPGMSLIPNKKGIGSSLSRIKTSSSNYHEWMCSVTSTLCVKLSTVDNTSFYPHLIALLDSVPQLAIDCFPAIVHAVLATEQERSQRNHRDDISELFTKTMQQRAASQDVLSAIIDVHLYLRQQTPVAADHVPLQSDEWLSTDYLLLAQQAIACKLYTTALLFLEVYRDRQAGEFHAKQDTISEMLYEVYSNVEDPDSFYGIKSHDVRRSLMQRSHHEEDWQKAFHLHSAEFESNPIVSQVASSITRQSERDIGKSLHQMGYNRMAGMLSDATWQGGKDGHRYIDYEVAWRTEDWSLPLPSRPSPGSGVGVMSALRALHRDRDATAIVGTIEKALCIELQGLKGAGIEAISQVHRTARNLMSVRETDTWHDLMTSCTDVEQALSRVGHWAKLSDKFDLKDYECLQMVRQSLLHAERQKAQGDQIGDMMESSTIDLVNMESDLFLRVSKMARTQDRTQLAMNAITTAERLLKQLPEGPLSRNVLAEFASVLWAQGEHVIAIQALQERLLQPGDSSGTDALLKAQMGEWAAVARSQQPQAIDEQYFRPALSLAQERREDMAVVSYRYACFADEQYRNLENSREMDQLELFISHRQEEIRQNTEEMGRTGPRTGAYKVLNYHRSQAEKILKQDLSTLEQHQSSRSLFLQQAFKMYANALTHSDDYDDAVVRLTSLWFENSSADDFNHAIADALQKISAHKFIGLTHQLSSRLSNVRSSGSRSPTQPFHTNLFVLMDRMCQAHPFHSLYAIYALRKADVQSGSASSSKSSSRSSLPPSSQQQSRSAAAHALWDRAKTSSPHKAQIVHFEQGCDAYVQWAELDLKVKMPHLFSAGSIKKGPYRFSSNLNLAIKALPPGVVPVATAKIPIDPSGQYKDVTTIERYSDVFNTAGGLHLPKIIECIASDGKRHKQLFKSQDDLRQDAVMQQVFTLLNELLLRDRKASKRELNIRTYAVIPLGPQCGLLEFVGNTSPIGEVLISTHERYRQEGQITPSQARGELAAVMGKTPREKLETFRQVCKDMPPAFHYYFLERFKVPSTWFAVRLNYSRSMATTSIIGHVLGLGDRHVSNILLDNVSGEMIHIDFGVAFEQGKLLPIPELVPFRLTRDLVDGMGMSGVEGVFRRCCEETLRVLRENSDVIKTVLEVFKFDPLWAWTSNPVKVLRAQRTSGTGDEPPPPTPTPTPGGTNNSRTSTQAGGGALVEGRDTASLSAERAIGSVMSKLSSNLSVQYTVNELIRTATDEGNLSAIFHGWQAAL
ncbi:unnamed protein product [Sympodiomycopsis kandeliae]